MSKTPKAKKVKLNIALVEETYRLNFDNKYKDLVFFVEVVWDLTHYLLNCFIDIKSPTPKQMVCSIVLCKSQRLLRTIYKLTSSGYWAEAEILHRSQFELQVLLFYILEDKTDVRANRWLGFNNKQCWDMAELLKTSPKEFRNAYGRLCSYVHNHPTSTVKFADFIGKYIHLKTGPLGGKDTVASAYKLLSVTAMMQGGFLEIVSNYVGDREAWLVEYEKLTGTVYYRTRILIIQQRLQNTSLQNIVKDTLKKVLP